MVATFVIEVEDSISVCASRISLQISNEIIQLRVLKEEVETRLKY